jgi:hypothetical protein
MFEYIRKISDSPTIWYSLVDCSLIRLDKISRDIVNFQILRFRKKNKSPTIWYNN